MANEAKDNFKRLFSKLRSDKKSLAAERADDGRSSYRSHQKRLDLLNREIENGETDLGVNRKSQKQSPLPGTEAAAKKEAERVRPDVYGSMENWKNAVRSHPIASKVFAGVEPKIHDRTMTFSKMDNEGFSHHLKVEPSETSGKFRVGVRAGDTRHKFLPFEYGSLPVTGDDNDLNKAMDSAFSSHDLRNSHMKAMHTGARTFDYGSK